MSFSYAEKNTPFVLSPESLDEHLAKGWYRMGCSIFTSHFLFFNSRPFSAIWIRVDLSTFKFSKSQRKLLKRNAKHFLTTAGPRIIDGEREELYQVYADDFDGRISPTIAESLEDYGDSCVFNTFEVTVREKVSDKLAAVSYFDLGDNSAASILGIYDPMMKSFSLGYYTMLLEIEHCLEQGLRYYYPGYVVPGYHRFDYKLRLGDSQYYNLQQQEWLPYSKQEIDEYGPIESQCKKLGEVIDGLTSIGVDRHLLIYPLFEAGIYDAWNDNYFPYPYLIFLGVGPKKQPIVLCFDPVSLEYRILHCAHMVQSQLLFNASYLNSFDEAEFYTRILSVTRTLYTTSSLSNLLQTISRGLQAPNA